MSFNVMPGAIADIVAAAPKSPTRYVIQLDGRKCAKGGRMFWSPHDGLFVSERNFMRDFKRYSRRGSAQRVANKLAAKGYAAVVRDLKS